MIPKFRAWDVDLKTMYEVKSLVYTLKVVLGVNRAALYPERTLYWDTENMVLMQSTGVVDKNGQEIFEGDVLKCCITKEPENYWFEAVFWNSGKAWFESKDKNHVEPFDNLVNDKHIICKVIGNIYENPDLV